MPELPEVETVRESLVSVVRGKRIAHVDVFYRRLLPQNAEGAFVTGLLGAKVLDIRRRGKYLLFLLSSHWYLVIHLRMTGRLIYVAEPDEPYMKHTSAVIAFDDHSQLRFVDQRKFGTMHLLEENDLHQIAGLRTLGPEPLSDQFTPARLKETVARPVKIKALLLNQQRIAGLGNIYADEALFRAKIHPDRLGEDLTWDEATQLHVSIRQVLTEAIAHQGTTVRDYRNGYDQEGTFQQLLRVYQKTGTPCVCCGDTISKTRVAGRSSHYCPQCQRCETP